MSLPKTKYPLVGCCLCDKSVSRTNISRHFRQVHQELKPHRRKELVGSSSNRMSEDGQHVDKDAPPLAQDDLFLNSSGRLVFKLSDTYTTSKMSPPKTKCSLKVSCCICDKSVSRTNISKHFRNVHQERKLCRRKELLRLSSNRMSEDGQHVDKDALPLAQCTEKDTNITTTDASTETIISAAGSTSVVSSDQNDQCSKSVQVTTQTSSVVSEVLPSATGPTDSEKEPNVTTKAGSTETIGSVVGSTSAVSSDKLILWSVVLGSDSVQTPVETDDVVQTPVETDDAVPSSPAVISSAEPADPGTESTDVSTGSAPVDGPHTSPSKTVQSVARNWQAKKTAVSKTPAKSQKVYPMSAARRGRPKTVDKDVQFEACLSSSSVRKLLLDIKKSVAKIGSNCVKMQQRPIRNTADCDRCSGTVTGTRYKTLLKTDNLTQLLFNCNGLIALQSHQDLLFCRVCQTRCEKAAYSPSCSDDQFGLFRHCLGKGYGDFSKPTSNFRALRRDIWTHLNDSSHIHRLETWFMQNQANWQKEYQTGFICAGDEIVQRVKKSMSTHRNPVRPAGLANKVAGASSATPEYHATKITSASKPTAPTLSQPAAPGASKHAAPAASKRVALSASKHVTIVVGKPGTLAASKTATSAASKHAALAASKPAAPVASTPAALVASKYATIAASNWAAPVVLKPAAPAASKPSTPDVRPLAKTLTSLPQGCTPIRVAFENRNISNSAPSSNIRIQSPMFSEDDDIIASDAPVVEGEDMGDSDFSIDGESSRLEEQDDHDNVQSSKDPAVGEIQPDLIMPTKSPNRFFICRRMASGKLFRSGSIHIMNHKADSSQTVASTHDESYNEVTHTPVTDTAPTKTSKIIRSCVPEEVEPNSGTVPLVSSYRHSSAGGSVPHQKTVAALDQDVRVKLEPQNQDEGLRETGPFMVLDCPETGPPEVASSCGESAAACGSSPRSDVAGHELEELSTVVKEEPIVADVDVHAEEGSWRPEVTCTEKSNSPAHTQSFLSQQVLSVEHSQTPVILPDSSGTITRPLLSTSAGGDNRHERVASYAVRKTRNYRTRRPSYVRAPSKASSSDVDGGRELPGTCSPSKRTGVDAQTDNLSKRLKTV